MRGEFVKQVSVLTVYEVGKRRADWVKLKRVSEFRSRRRGLSWLGGEGGGEKRTER